MGGHDSHHNLVEEWQDHGFCTEMFPRGSWKPLKCHRYRPFVCQRTEMGIPSSVGMIVKKSGNKLVSRKSVGGQKSKCGPCVTLKQCQSECERLDHLRREKRSLRKYEEALYREH